MIERTFQDIPDDSIYEADQQSFQLSLGWQRGSTWEELLKSKRVLIVSEAGAGKTHECRTQAKRLWEAGEPAFFVELAALASEPLCDLLDSDEEDRLDTWLESKSGLATFFLDSFDELKLTTGSFERALKRLKKSIGSLLHRVVIVITTRPIPFDQMLVRKILPFPENMSTEPDENGFANIAVRGGLAKSGSRQRDTVPDWRSVALMPFSDDQIKLFALEQRVEDPEQLLKDLQRRNAQEFARRPQDLVELCADWQVHKRIRTHRDQVSTNIRVKLLPRDDRLEPAELSIDKAIEGASKLALAALMTRRLTIRHNAASDAADKVVALDPAIILSDWPPNERKALLERPLFGFASYGRVRFHHRSVAEYLAAERLQTLRKEGMPIRALKRILFAETKGKTIARPSKRPMTAWLALQNQDVFQLLRDNEPAVLLNEGDPESLNHAQRIHALNAYVIRYGSGGWRGLEVPRIQIHRFSSTQLADEISRIWRSGVANPEVRETLINLVEAGRINCCADIAFDIALDTEAASNERVAALEALVALNDRRLEQVAVNIANADGPWSDVLACDAIERLFPERMSIEQLIRALTWIRPKKRTFGGFSRQLPRLILESSLDRPNLEKLRDGLVELVASELKWEENKWPQLKSNRPYLIDTLVATCDCGLECSRSEEWLRASSIGVRLLSRDHSNDELVNPVRKRLRALNADDNERLFWIVNEFLQSVGNSNDPMRRLAEITTHDGPVQLQPSRDLGWVTTAFGDSALDLESRSMLLLAAIRLKPKCLTWKDHESVLRPLVRASPKLAKILEDTMEANLRVEDEVCSEEKLRAEQKEIEEEKRSRTHESWLNFRREVANQPDSAFSPEKRRGTAWDLWEVMRRAEGPSQSPGWNRRFIEEHFDDITADKLREVLMEIWRDDEPTLHSERPKDKRDMYLQRWLLGLAGIYAESENKDWATSLSEDEAKLAARYVPLEMNSLQQWGLPLVISHPGAIDQTLGVELSWELEQSPGALGHSSLLQGIAHSPIEVARVFLPRLEIWLENFGDQVKSKKDATGMAERVRQLVQIILKYGDTNQTKRLMARSAQRLALELPFEQRLVWLKTVMKIDPPVGIEYLAEILTKTEPVNREDPAMWLAGLFGDRQDEIELKNQRFSPLLLLRLLRLAYQHVRLEDDLHHEEGCYAPTTRDNAESARNKIVSALFNLRGEDGLAAKLEMSKDPLCDHFKDHIIAAAEENWAHEIDSDSFDEHQVVELNRYGEAPATTNSAMFSLLKDRLSDLEDLLLSDASPRRAWAEISIETVMRQEIARALENAANSVYRVDQEAVTADEKETDIRLRSTASLHEAVIELKLADERSANDLCSTIENQLVKKYMAKESCRAGALLITLSRDRKWKHPGTGLMIDVNELHSMLCKEAQRIEAISGGTMSIAVHILDLRPRLARERE